MKTNLIRTKQTGKKGLKEKHKKHILTQTRAFAHTEIS